ncbi:MAG TPA: formate dehydrogenase subunit gamma [Thermoanaerobaculia bacterium]|jgi:formate dehydrogenase subunit gamma
MKRDDLKRFTFAERVVHWVVGLSFTFLLLTGLAFSYPSLFWLTALVGGGPAARWMHPWMGVALSVGLVAMFFLWLKDMLLGKADVHWLSKVRHYALHERDKVPPAGKYNAGQKLFYWLMIFLGLAHLATGIPLWRPAGYGAGFLNAMRFVHYLVTVPGGLLLIVHVYLGTVAYPGTARGMLYGRVSRAWARLHHPLWHERETKP